MDGKVANGTTKVEEEEEGKHSIDPADDIDAAENNKPCHVEGSKKNGNVVVKSNGSGGNNAGASAFRQKHFQARPALLERHFALEDGHSTLLFNFGLALFILVSMAAWTHDFHLHGNPFHHLWLVRWNFEQLPATMLLWTAMFLCTLLVPFYGLKLWTYFGPPEWTQPLCILGYIFYQFGLFYCSIQALFWMHLKGACCFIITCENTRLAMKAHSFVRENFPKAKELVERRRRAVVGKPQEDEQQPVDEEPTLGRFLYFLFCPSLLYRHSYPRSPSRSWRKVGRHFLGCLASMYLVNLSFVLCIIPRFGQLNFPEEAGLPHLLYTIFPSIFPGAICLFIGIFYGLLHSWLSMFAEAMQFADRLFYANWWSSRNMAEYYRNWNLVVHDWLYVYVYKEISMLSHRKWAPALAQVLVFLASSIFHEYWFGIGLRMFYPTIFTLYFVFGGVFFLLSRLIKEPYIWNILMWWNLLIGTGIFVTCYASEWYARQKCDRVYEDDLLDLLVPRVWICHRSTT